MEAVLVLTVSDPIGPTVPAAFVPERKGSSGQAKVPFVWVKALAVDRGLG
jgi:hypothetical protein